MSPTPPRPPRPGESAPGEPLGDVPRAACDLGVAGRGAAAHEPGRAALLHEAARSGEAVAGHVGGGGVQGRQGAALLVLGEQAVAHAGDGVHQSAPAVELQVGGRVAGVRGGGPDLRPGRVKPALELGREQQVGELGLPVGPPRPAGPLVTGGIVAPDQRDALVHDAVARFLRGSRARA
jgi:hypothetical protein